MQNQGYPSTKIVMITQVFYPDSQATSQLLSALAQALATPSEQRSPSNLHIEVLCGYPSNARGRRTNSQHSEQWGSVQISRGGFNIDAKKSLFHRALSYASFLAWLFWSLLFKVKTTDRVLVVTNPPFAPLIVWLATKFRSLFKRPFKYFIVLHDIYPDGLIALGSISKKRVWTKIWMAFNRRAFNRAHQVITLGRDMSKHCHEQYLIPTDRLTVIPNWSPIDFEGIDPLKPHETELWNTLPPHAQTKDSFIIQYSGNMGLWHNMEGIVEAANLLTDIPIHFLMIGDGRRKQSAQEKSETLQLTNMTWLPFQPLDTLTDSLQCAHMSLVSQREEVLGIMVPSKFYGILASRRAVLAQVPSQSEVALTIGEHDCGIVLDHDDPHLLAEHLRKLYLDRAQVHNMGRSAGIAYEQYYSFTKAVDAFSALLSP
jgi:glycosyltransferase involved in cell wall biosynthesis